MQVLKAEKTIGIETFFTNTNGIGGKLRTTPIDFIVQEVSEYPSRKEDGKYAIACVTVVNWETNLLVRELSKRLHVSRRRISFAGTKDKRAKTSRLMSFYNVPVDVLSKVKIEDVEIEDIYRSDKAVNIGGLIGNIFNITIRNVDGDAIKDQVTDTCSFIEKNGGFPNFFGIQRFGIVRPITHVVGKNIVADDFEKAVMSYIANPLDDDEETYKLRENLQKTYDFSEALKTYPFHLNFEKAILNKLVVNSEDFVAALKELPKNLLTMFIYAYQSYLFNKIISERIKKGIPINEAIVGDVVLPVRKNVIEATEIFVTERNIEKVNKQIRKKRAFVSGVLFGCDSTFSKGEMGEIEQKVITDEKLDHRDFIIPEIPFISSSGSRRSIFASVKNLEYNFVKDDRDNEKNMLNLKFELRKGCYATSLLREFMKADDIRSY